ncbi:putative bifunctional diguanylate cyclase/phosphodiesterase [Deinococcus aquaticus]|uniref:EAL domain-containing protein n=1 Tax=Deinococcus aquaticus TaxID=328692 RepID=A0ABY7V2X6_9DEIO|nr:EAL domain-containing protein [Deinococcus aquaticus]WDA59485.1 EAL domain-containing protein [Deinococcus aquaticus]
MTRPPGSASLLRAARTPVLRAGEAGLADAVLDTTDTLVVVLDTAGRVVRFNPACERLSGLSFEQVRGQVLWPLVLDDDEAPGVQEVFVRLLAGETSARHENHWRDVHGERRVILWSNKTLLDWRGRPSLVVATGVDITAERRAQAAQHEVETRFRALFERSADGLVLIDPHDPDVPWRIVDCNEAFCRMNGYDAEDLIGASIDLLHPYPMMAQEGSELLAWIREEQPVHGEGAHRHRNGTIFPIESASSLVTVGGREMILGQDRDISARKRADEQLRELAAQLAFDAQHDALTGLPNRTLLLDRLQLELRRATRSGHAVAVIFLDLDGFKRVNDMLGHAVGDDLLREVAARLQGCLRPADTVARLGGDEFVAVIPDLPGREEAARVARRLQEALAPVVQMNGQQINVQSSVGVAIYPPDSSLPANLLRQADMAMYQAKRAGKNGIEFFAPNMDVAAHSQMHIEVRLRRALQENLMHLHYQPQVDVQTGELLGFEALLRWTDPHLGTVPPNRFIPVAEETGLIVPLGRWVLNEACRQVAEWRLTVPVAVNVSALEVAREDFVETVAETLRRHGLSGENLKLELTERLAVRDLHRAARHLSELRALGIRLSLDDFGTGQSSVSTLLQLPMDELKLDRSLIMGIADSPADQRVVGALLGLARGLNLNVIVEGVETDAQYQVLRAMECGAVQGYLTGRPGPPDVWAGRIQPHQKSRLS